VEITYDAVKDTIDPEHAMSHDDFAVYLGLGEDDLSKDEFLADFVEAVRAFYDEIIDQL
jgi:hypothetical protein